MKDDSPKSGISSLQMRWAGYVPVLDTMCKISPKKGISRLQMSWAGFVPFQSSMCNISPNRAVQKVTRIKECGTQTATKKTNETESASSPSGCSEKPVLAMQAKLANGKFSVFNVNRSVPRKPASSGRAGKPFERLGQNLYEKPRGAFKGTSQHHCHNL